MAESTSLSLATLKDGVPTTTSLIIAEGIGAQHKNVLELIRKNRADFEEFGGVAFETRPFETAGGVQERTIAVLNRDHAILLMTYMRNTPVVRAFKKNLIRAFLELERRLSTPAELQIPQTYAEALRAAADNYERAERAEADAARKALQLEVATPKVMFADAVAASKTSILVSELAKILKGNGIDIGGRRLFHWLRVNGYLVRRKGIEWNMPTQRAMELGLFEVKETAVTHSDGHVTVSKTPKVTGKGQEYFVSRFLDGRFRMDASA